MAGIAQSIMADESFKEFVLDQLAALPEVKARAMFGAHGLYQGEQFFAILDEGRLSFKTDETSRADYLARSMKPFTYRARGKLMTLNYHEVPPEILENAPALVAWTQQAIVIAAVQPKRRVQPRSPQAGRRARRGK
jgi:DNA transformation protein